MFYWFLTSIFLGHYKQPRDCEGWLLRKGWLRPYKFRAGLRFLITFICPFMKGGPKEEWGSIFEGVLLLNQG